MQAVTVKPEERPQYSLLKQTDIQNFYHLQMPRWLFDCPKYSGLSLESKVAYMFLLNRFQLSRLNGWLNENGEVFIIYTRQSLANEMQVSYRKIIACMKELAAVNLIWEKRCGRGNANQIYLAKVDLLEQCSPNSSAPFVDETNEACARSANSAYQDSPAPKTVDASSTPQEVPNTQLSSAGSTYQEVPKPHPSNTKKNYNKNNINVSPSAVTRQEEKELQEILGSCGLPYFPPDVALTFEAAIERLYYSTQFKVGNALLPQKAIRQRLHQLNEFVLREAERKLQTNGNRIKNSTAYVMATVFNAISELHSDILIDPYLNGLKRG